MTASDDRSLVKGGRKLTRLCCWGGGALLLLLLGAWGWNSTGLLSFRLQHFSEPELRAWVERHPDEPLGHLQLGLRRERENPREAAHEYFLALQGDPTLAPARGRLARLLLGDRNLQIAEPLIREGLQQAPSDPDLRMAYATLLGAQSQDRRALAEWSVVTRQAPGNAEAWLGWGQCSFRLNEEERALPALRRAVALAPRLPEARVALVDLLRQRREYEEATVQARAARGLAPHSPDVILAAAKLESDRDGATEEAETAMREAAAARPQDAFVRYLLGSICSERGQFAAAEREFRGALVVLNAQRPASTDSWRGWDLWFSQQEAIRFNLARALRKLRKEGEAALQLAAIPAP